MFAPPPAAEQLARELSQEMPSPYCPGRSISSCPSGMARKLEEDILAAAAAGQTRDEIEETLVARFGREKMGYAQSNAVFIFVTIAALLAILGLVLTGRRMAKRRILATAPPGGPDGGSSESQAGAPARQAGPSQSELDDLEEALDAIDGL